MGESMNPDQSTLSTYESWLAAYNRAYQSPRDTGSIVCPSCGARSLRLVFVVDEPEATISVVAFWCDSCVRGLMPNRAQVPAGGCRAFRGEEDIPDYRLVIPA